MVGDLMFLNNEESDWIPGEHLGLSWLDEITQLLTIPTDSVGIRYGQCWYTDSESVLLPEGTLVEILGKTLKVNTMSENGNKSWTTGLEISIDILTASHCQEERDQL